MDTTKILSLVFFLIHLYLTYSAPTSKDSSNQSAISFENQSEPLTIHKEHVTTASTESINVSESEFYGNISNESQHGYVKKIVSKVKNIKNKVTGGSNKSKNNKGGTGGGSIGSKGGHIPHWRPKNSTNTGRTAVNDYIEIGCFVFFAVASIVFGIFLACAEEIAKKKNKKNEIKDENDNENESMDMNEKLNESGVEYEKVIEMTDTTSL